MSGLTILEIFANFEHIKKIHLIMIRIIESKVNCVKQLT